LVRGIQIFSEQQFLRNGTERQEQNYAKLCNLSLGEIKNSLSPLKGLSHEMNFAFDGMYG